jgi:hypothetical protein
VRAAIPQASPLAKCGNFLVRPATQKKAQSSGCQGGWSFRKRHGHRHAGNAAGLGVPFRQYGVRDE